MLSIFQTKTMSSEHSKTKGFKFSSKIDLDALILSAINDLCDPKTNKEAASFDVELEKLQGQVKVAESKWFTKTIIMVLFGFYISSRHCRSF